MYVNRGGSLQAWKNVNFLPTRQDFQHCLCISLSKMGGGEILPNQKFPSKELANLPIFLGLGV